jgi:hypothetical protein
MASMPSRLIIFKQWYLGFLLIDYEQELGKPGFWLWVRNEIHQMKILYLFMLFSLTGKQRSERRVFIRRHF